MKTFDKTAFAAIVFLTPVVVLWELDGRGYVVGDGLFVAIAAVSVVGVLWILWRNGPRHVEPSLPVRNQDPKKFAVEPTFYRLFLPGATRLEDAGRRVVYTGKLLDRADRVFRALLERLAPAGFIPVLTENMDPVSRKSDGPVKIILTPVPVPVPSHEPKLFRNAMLLAFTALCLFWVMGANYAGGLPNFTAAVHGAVGSMVLTMALCGIEGARYLITKYVYGVTTSYPAFVSAPTGFGAFGSVTRIYSQLFSRRQLFDTVYAGPVLAFILGFALLIIEFDGSQIVPEGMPVPDGFRIHLGSSILLSLLGQHRLGVEIGIGHMLSVSPLTFIGWMILLITSVGLLPLGEIAGGRLVRALLSRRSVVVVKRVAWVVIVLLGILNWGGWLIFGALVALVSYRHRTKVLNDISPAAKWQKVLGVLLLMASLGVLVPLPHSFYHVLGLHCPYV